MRDTTEAVMRTLQQCAEASAQKPLTVGEVLTLLQDHGYSFICITFILPFMQPVPLGPLSVIAGSLFCILGWQWLHQHHAPVLPQRIQAVEISSHTWQIILRLFMRILRLVDKVARPRYNRLFRQYRHHICGGVLMSAGALMAIPFGVLPFNNTVPGFAILFLAIGEIEEDGLMIGLAFFWLIATLCYFSGFVILLWMFGEKTLHFFH